MLPACRPNSAEVAAAPYKGLSGPAEYYNIRESKFAHSWLQLRPRHAKCVPDWPVCTYCYQVGDCVTSRNTERLIPYTAFD